MLVFKLYLNDVNILEQAKLIFQKVEFVDKDYEQHFMVDNPIKKVYRANVKIEHDEGIVGDLVPVIDVSDSRHRPHAYTGIEDLYHSKIIMGTKLVKMIKNSREYMGEGR